ncbi:hypothetical protein CROQUDRAFT_674270 [Cronartium quercuum f. sp. fusiforme G11]|uniref:MSP domain-containing protein n=1 Tax=Cronartium quercuum f. sp. fusiforme G11 TaxID=708437 RepID=A0A9P6NC91_9BASI|nr:hypothetical protein CROQUDRAFT_674270 [Cronartium quercuum f. sp. fusiforme G11]
MSVVVNPSQLGFQRPLTQLVKRTLTVSNPNAQPIAFKVKTTAPKQYCVRPNSGRIEPGERVEVSVLLQPMKEDPEAGAKCRDKFLVQSTIITPERESRPFAELWSSVEKEDKNSISEHKIRCTYLPSAEDPAASHQAGEFGTQKSNGSANLATNPHHTTNRDEDDDPRYNSVRSHTTGSYHPTTSGSPQARSESDQPDTTVYEAAHDESFAGRQRFSSSATTPQSLKHRTSAQNSLSAMEDKKVPVSGQATIPPRSINTIQPTSNTTLPINPEEFLKMKSQLSAAQKEIERLKVLVRQGEEGLRRRNTHSTSSHSPVNGADMMTLGVHGLKGPAGLVPVQTVVLISIGVFAFTWLFF